VYVRPNSNYLKRSDGSSTLGVTDDVEKTVYISDMLTDTKLDKVLCHELCHVYSFSYELDIPIATEELIADFLATYGRDIFMVADDILQRFVEVA